MFESAVRSGRARRHTITIIVYNRPVTRSSHFFNQVNLSPVPRAPPFFGQIATKVRNFPLSKKLPGILIELKTDKNCSEKQLEALSKIALKQINDRTYSAELSAMGVSTILKYGIAFSGKKARITVETETI